MGLDVRATRNGECVKWDGVVAPGAKLRIADPVLYKAFTSAARRVQKRTGSVDADLPLGGLDCHLSREVVIQFFQRHPTTAEGLQAATSTYEFANALLRHRLNPKPDPLVDSAFEFLVVCREHGLGFVVE